MFERETSEQTALDVVVGMLGMYPWEQGQATQTHTLLLRQQRAVAIRTPTGEDEIEHGVWG